MTVDLRDGRCLVDVEDDGVGLSTKAAAKIAGRVRFSTWGGRGTGIAAARKWLEEYGGTLELCDGPRRLKGARFRIALPVLPAPE